MPTFTVNWHNEPRAWERHLVPRLAGARARGLEIGSYEGRTACWLLDHVLTHPESHLDCVDPHAYAGDDSESRLEASAYAGPMDQVLARFRANVAPYGPRLRHWRMPSDTFFRVGPRDAYNLVVVDGMHSALPTLRDLVHAWQALAAGGLLLVDDLKWEGRDGFQSYGPQRALDGLLGCVPADDVRILHRRYIAILEKLQ